MIGWFFSVKEIRSPDGVLAGVSEMYDGVVSGILIFCFVVIEILIYTQEILVCLFYYSDKRKD